jgi:hypothetical protein
MCLASNLRAISSSRKDSAGAREPGSVSFGDRNRNNGIHVHNEDPVMGDEVTHVSAQVLPMFPVYTDKSGMTLGRRSFG